MIGNDRGGGKEMVRSSDGRSFLRRGAVMNMAGYGCAYDRIGLH